MPTFKVRDLMIHLPGGEGGGQEGGGAGDAGAAGAGDPQKLAQNLQCVHPAISIVCGACSFQACSLNACSVNACSLIACSHLACTIQACSHLACSQIACTLQACSNNACSYIACSHNACSILACSHNACTFQACSHLACSNLACSHLACSFNACSHNACSFIACSNPSFYEPCGLSFIDPTKIGNPEHLKMLREQLRQQLEAVDNQEKAIDESLKPQTLDQVKQLEQQLTGALEELRAQRAQLEKPAEGDKPKPK
jgi:hypothetical protein